VNTGPRTLSWSSETSEKEAWDCMIFSQLTDVVEASPASLDQFIHQLDIREELINHS